MPGKYFFSGEQQGEGHGVVHHDQVEHYQGQFEKVSQDGHQRGKKDCPPSLRRILQWTPCTTNQTMNQTTNQTMNQTMNKTMNHEP